MAPQINELETILQALIDEHRRLLTHLEAQQAAMKTLELKAMDLAGKQQEGSRLRIAGLETRRRLIVGQLARAARVQGLLTLSQLAEMHPPRREALLKLRGELKELVSQVAARSHVAGKLAGAVLGHLNTVVRLLAGVVEQAGLYTKHGVPQVSSRIGVMEAVG